MNKQDIQKFICMADITLVKAMQVINANVYKIIFLADASQKLIACITDGDIRRFLLSGGKLDDPAISAANNNPKIAHSLEEAKCLYHKKNFFIIPIVDSNGIIIDLYSEDSGTVKERPALNIPVVINAGGRGSRLDPFTKVLPKPLIPVGDLPIIELIMKEYQTYSCNDFHIIVNYKRELMKAYFADNEKKYNITWYDEDKPLGTGGGLSLLKGQINDTFFFANCDALLTANYERMLQFHKDSKNVITMICAYKALDIPYGIVDIGLNGKIDKMQEKPTMTFLTNTGIYIVEPEVIDEMKNDVPVGFPDVIEMNRKKGRKVAVFPVNEDDWMDMGQISELVKMRKKLFGN